MLSLLELMSISSTILLLLISTNRYVDTPDVVEDDHDEEGYFDPLYLESTCNVPKLDFVTSPTLHSMRMSTAFAALDDELQFWVKSRSTTWFTRFLVEEYGDEGWVRLFRMTKKAVFALADLLRSQIQRQDTKYRLAAPTCGKGGLHIVQINTWGFFASVAPLASASSLIHSSQWRKPHGSL